VAAAMTDGNKAPTLYEALIPELTAGKQGPRRAAVARRRVDFREVVEGSPRG